MQSAVVPGTVTALVALYANSSQFKHEIATETRRTMWVILQKFRDEHGSKRVALLRREHVLAILDGRPPLPNETGCGPCDRS